MVEFLPIVENGCGRWEPGILDLMASDSVFSSSDFERKSNSRVVNASVRDFAEANDWPLSHILVRSAAVQPFATSKKTEFHIASLNHRHTIAIFASSLNVQATRQCDLEKERRLIAAGLFLMHSTVLITGNI